MSWDISEDLQSIRSKFESIREIAADMLVSDSVTSDFSISYARNILAQVDRLDRLQEALAPIGNAYSDICHNLTITLDGDGSGAVASGFRRIVVAVSDGMLKQSLLTLTDAKKRGVVRVGEKLEITLPSGETFTTEIVAPGNRLQERGRIKQFYAEQGIKEGDGVLIEEFESGKWKLTRDPVSDLAKYA